MNGEKKQGYNGQGNRFMRPPPGYSLTQPNGKFPFEQPPRKVDADEVVSGIIDNMEDERKRDQIVKLLFAGVSIEELTNTVAMTGFMEGEFNADVAELIKGPIAIYMLGIAEEYDIPVKFYANQKLREDALQGIDDSKILEIMRVRNPKFHEYLTKGHYDHEKDAQVQKDLKMTQGFLAVEGEEPEGEETMQHEASESPTEEREED